jgi:SpoVK/Ycf46/Vps4 family AAA+-type ATPase
MENFALIYDICRAAVAGDVAEGRAQIKRLGAALLKAGNKEDSDLLARLAKPSVASAARRVVSFSPSAVADTPQLHLAGETLLSAAHVPVDRESGAPLAEVIAVERLPEHGPTLNPSLENAVKDLVLEWRNIASLARLGLAPARTCLIYGPPGTGKTRLGEWLGRQLGVPVILVRLDGLMSSYLGTTSRNIGNLFKFANQYKAVLLLDEFDAIAKLRDDPNEIGEIKRIVNTLLQELDKRREHGFTIAITNHSNLLDPAVWRRFEVQLEMPVPDAVRRLEILRRYLVPLELSDGKQELLAWALKGCSGAEIEDIVKSLKKSFALEPENVALVDRLARVSHSHGGRLDADVKRLLASERMDLALWLVENPVFTQTKIAEALDLNRSTVSRWLKQNDKRGDCRDGADQVNTVHHELETAKKK